MRNFLKSAFSLVQRCSGFARFGRGSIVKPPYRIWNRRFISIGQDVFIAEQSFLALTTVHAGETFSPKLDIGDGTCIGAGFFAACIDEITIENEVLISDRVFVSDHIHGYRDLETPILQQPLIPRGKVRIKHGALVGINSVIMPGVTIGVNAVVGASSVVYDDVPDFSVAVGNPARVVKRYSKEEGKWITIEQ